MKKVSRFIAMILACVILAGCGAGVKPTESSESAYAPALLPYLSYLVWE